MDPAWRPHENDRPRWRLALRSFAGIPAVMGWLFLLTLWAQAVKEQ